MLNNVLDAYEEECRKDNANFKNIFKKLELVDKVFIITAIVVIALCVLLAFVCNNLKPILAMIIVLTLLLFIWVSIMRKTIQKKWEYYIERHNNNLDLLRKILKNDQFQMYKKNQIKQLIRKVQLDLTDLEKKHNKQKDSYYGLINNYIIPIVSFAGGILFKNMSLDNIVAICFIALLFIIAFKMFNYAVEIVITEIIEGNEFNRKKYFKEALQDLLDRDFPIEENDLL